MYEIIYTCKSINNKNVRNGELEILRKSKDDELCFEFGENEKNLKKRFYDNKEDFEDDFKKLEELKESFKNEEVKNEVVKNEATKEKKLERNILKSLNK